MQARRTQQGLVNVEQNALLNLRVLESVATATAADAGRDLFEAAIERKYRASDLSEI